MNLMEQLRDPVLIEGLIDEIRRETDPRRNYKFMEVCGTHTMSIFKYGIRSIIPENIVLLSGPGCPVCVTPVDFIDTALEMAKINGVITTTFGDMLRVPGTKDNLYNLRSLGCDIRTVYSPSDAVRIAAENPSKNVIFIAVGFETTSPTTAASILLAQKSGIKNFFILCGHKTMPNAMTALAQSGELKLDGFICPPHVSAITGTRIYDFLPEKYGKACVIGGFEPVDLLQTILMLIRQINQGNTSVQNQYSRVVTRNGNIKARQIIDSVYEACDSEWRGLGVIASSGQKINENYREYDAAGKYPIKIEKSSDNPACLCGDVLTGRKIPTDCSLFRKSCTPQDPKGACMVSSEGTCAAYFKYKK
jgi:hydrogenase expression/formation protein HypD